jgi:predicted metalloendopeptidase
MDWAAFFGGAKSRRRPRSSCGIRTQSAGSAPWFAASRSPQWKLWLTFHAIDRNASLLPKAFVDERFAFHSTR